MTYACVSCGKELPPLNAGDDRSTPKGATLFMSSGSSGSGVWDPNVHSVRGPFLQIAICDDCLRSAGNAGRVKETRRIITPIETEEREWNPAADAEEARARLAEVRAEKEK